MTLLRAAGVTAGYGGTPVLRDLDLAVEAGTITAVLGPNGAGKTTLLRMLSGQLRPSAGTVELSGTSIVGVPAAVLVRRGIAHCPQGRRIFGELSVAENLALGAYTLPKARIAEEVERWVAVFPVLGERMDQMGGSLSGGEQQMLAIARAMMSRPELLLLDEPSTGLSPVLTRRMFDAIAEIGASGVTVVVVEQNVGEAMRIATQTSVLAEGRAQSVDLQGTRGHEEVLAAYFGGGDDEASAASALA